MRIVLETSARLLGLLSLLQTRRSWTGPELADRLDVGVRTIRRDVDKLRSLGYPVEAAPGVAGGYRLGAGADLPPLLLDDEEAVAVAVGLRTAAGGTVAGMEETSIRALAKLEQVLPSRLRRRVGALQAYTVPVPYQSTATVDADVLATIAAACRDHEGLRFAYEAHDGTSNRREVQPHRLVHLNRRWYLVAWDVGREDWRTFRVDRIKSRLSPGRRFAPRPLPDNDVGAYVKRGVASARGTIEATVVLHGPLEELTERVPPWAGRLEARDEHSCILHASSDWVGGLAVYIAQIGVDFTAIEPPEFVEQVRSLADRFARAT
jgi:predicted DNA-binding transcriptional regulator YafY